jgi:selenide,water dikinase
MSRYEVHACTDITGFGLLGHLAEMVLGSGCGVRLQNDKIPFIPEAREYAQMGFIPAGAYRNREFRACMTEFAPPWTVSFRTFFLIPRHRVGFSSACPKGIQSRVVERIEVPRC